MTLFAKRRKTSQVFDICVRLSPPTKNTDHAAVQTLDRINRAHSGQDGKHMVSTHFALLRLKDIPLKHLPQDTTQGVPYAVTGPTGRN